MKTILLTIIALVSAIFFVPEAEARDYRHRGDRDRHYYKHHRSDYRPYYYRSPRRSYYYSNRSYYYPRTRAYYYDEPRYYRYNRRPSVSLSFGF